MPFTTLTFSCSESEIWQILGKDKKNHPLTERGRMFLPVLVEFLRRRPKIDKALCIVQQVRIIHKKKECQKIGTLLSLQQVPSCVDPEGAENPVLVAPAIYTEVDWNDARKTEEERAIKQLIGSGYKFKTLFQRLNNDEWCYDLVLRLLRLNEEVEEKKKRGVVSKATLEVRIEAKIGEHCKPFVSGIPVIRTDIGEDITKSPLRHCICLPWLSPRKRLTADSDKCVLFLVASDELRRTLNKVSRQWGSLSIRNILLAAESGSGKEVVARLIHHGRATKAFVSTSTGGQSWNSFQIQLFGQGQPGGPPVFLGIMDEGLGGTVMVDEIDKASQEVRSGLLRVIESDEFHRPGGGEKITMTRESRPLFIFVGSGEGVEGRKKKKAGVKSVKKRMESEPPKDFWDRMDCPIPFAHPFGPENRWKTNETKELLRKYVSLFMLRAKENLKHKKKTPYIWDEVLELSNKSTLSRLKGDFWEKSINALQKAIYNGSAIRPSLRVVRATSQDYVKILHDCAQIGTLDTINLYQTARKVFKERIGP